MQEKVKCKLGTSMLSPLRRRSFNGIFTCSKLAKVEGSINARIE